MEYEFTPGSRIVLGPGVEKFISVENATDKVFHICIIEKRNRITIEIRRAVEHGET